MSNFLSIFIVSVALLVAFVNSQGQGQGKGHGKNSDHGGAGGNSSDAAAGHRKNNGSHVNSTDGDRRNKGDRAGACVFRNWMKQQLNNSQSNATFPQAKCNADPNDRNAGILCLSINDTALRWYYDKAASQCQPFFGCKNPQNSNSNSFPSQDSCAKTCGVNVTNNNSTKQDCDGDEGEGPNNSQHGKGLGRGIGAPGNGKGQGAAHGHGHGKGQAGQDDNADDK